MLLTLFTCSLCILFFFFFKQKTAYEMRISDWSSDVCSSDLAHDAAGILLREKSFWYGDEQIDIEHDDHDQRQQHQQACRQGPVEAAFIGLQPAREAGLAQIGRAHV